MKTPVRIFLIIVCALMIALMPFIVSSPIMLEEVRDEIQFEDEGDEDFTALFFSKAFAEGAVEIESIPQNDGLNPVPVEWELPMDDFSKMPQPDASKFTENRYEDETIIVTLEEEEADQVKWIIARIQVSSPSQLRTAYSKSPATISKMAKTNNAVIAINGDYLENDPQKTTFEVRMGKEIRKKGNAKKDMLVIDEKGDFHLFKKSEGLFEKNSKNKWVYIYEGSVVNAFTFGPALVIDGEVQQVDEGYGYNPNHLEPRSAIGQTGELSYVFVLAASTDRDGKTGVTHQQLAEKMGEIGCMQAYNLDGGGTAEIVFNGVIYRASPGDKERGQSDMIYVGTLVPDGQ